jgi:hypothetical protein
MWRFLSIAILLAAAAPGGAAAQIAVSANDAKVKLIDGKVVIQKDPVPDTVQRRHLAAGRLRPHHR